MFPRVFASVLFLFIAAGAFAATSVAPAATNATSAKPAPILTVDNLRHDFGTIHRDQTVTHRYRVSNTGNAPLHILAVEPVCGCTSTVAGKMELAPGESTEILAIFTPEKGFTGAVRKTIRVSSDDPAHAVITLRFAALVRPASDAVPPS
jgi:hypothetical protein